MPFNNSLWKSLTVPGYIRNKLFALFFMGAGLFYLGMVIWTVTTGGESERSDFLEVTGRGANCFIFGYIAYQIHSDIRSKMRYRKDQPLYEAVKKNMESHFDPETTDINIPIVRADDFDWHPGLPHGNDVQ